MAYYFDNLAYLLITQPERVPRGIKARPAQSTQRHRAHRDAQALGTPLWKTALSRSRRRSGGFTFVELCFGLVITALVMAALATFSLAMSTAWQNAGASEDILLQANQDVRLLDAKIRPCALTGGWQAGSLDGSASLPAAVLLWTADTNSSATVNYGEIMLIEHDPATEQLNLYQAPVPLAVPDTVYSYANVFSQASVISTFKEGLTPTVLCRNVVAAQFYVGPANSTIARPFVEFALTVKSGNQTQVVYGDATLRAPLAAPTN
jgi:type II secretory pathway pseudopilin PulG